MYKFNMAKEFCKIFFKYPSFITYMIFINDYYC